MKTITPSPNIGGFLPLVNKLMSLFGMSGVSYPRRRGPSAANLRALEIVKARRAIHGETPLKSGTHSRQQRRRRLLLSKKRALAQAHADEVRLRISHRTARAKALQTAAMLKGLKKTEAEAPRV